MSKYYEVCAYFIKRLFREPPQHNENDVERRNRTLVEAARTMLIFSKAPMFLWAEAVATACYTQNRSLIHTRHNKTPYELVHDKNLILHFSGYLVLLSILQMISKIWKSFKAKSDIGIFRIDMNQSYRLTDINCRNGFYKSSVSTTIAQDAPSTSHSLLYHDKCILHSFLKDVAAVTNSQDTFNYSSRPLQSKNQYMPSSNPVAENRVSAHQHQGM
ncbi:retrovirus-related pol polyprotein from transposon TNT 1-94 [Tanacetum coccineum]